MRVVITGATSFIGSAVAKALLPRGYEVYGIVRPESKAKSMLPVHPDFHIVSGNTSHPEIWASEIGSADIFLHFAWGGPGAAGRADKTVQQANVVDTMACIHAAHSMGVKRFIFSGSQAEYGKTCGIISEDTPCSPILEYGKCKLQVRQQAPILAEKLGMDYIHLRIFSIYGPGDHPYTLVPSCIRTFLEGGRMEMSSCEQKWNFLHITDAAEAVCMLAECDISGESSPVVIIAGTDTRVLRDYVLELYDLAGRNGECAFGARQGGEQPVDNWPDVSKLCRLTGWKPRVSFAEGIAELIMQEKERSQT